MVAERKRVDRLVKDITSTPVGVPLPSYRYGRRLGVYTQEYPSDGITLMRSFIQPVKAGWQCGQQAKDKLHIYCSQAHKMTFALI
ncbi:hypothetical protein FJU37_13055 [Acinetobacter baumannii]|nr:hypothetical protein FJU37_13055 [Acinetobacter baumannii]